MSVRVAWDNEAKTTILWTFVGRWTWGEYDDARQAVTDMIKSVDHPVDFIYDVRSISIIPADVVTRFKTQYLARMEGSHLYLVVGADSNIKLLWNTFTNLPYARHLRAYFFDALDEARDFLRQYGQDGEEG